MNLDNEVIDFIIYLIDSHNQTNKSTISQPYSIKNSAKYILRQIIRQMSIPHENMYVSQEALTLWVSKTNDNIKEKQYRDWVKCKVDWHDRPVYIGAEKEPRKTVPTYKDKRFRFNEVFIDEHIVPVETIIQHLLKLNTNDIDIKKQIESILSNLNICKLLKKENATLNKYKRPINVNEVLKTEYKKIKVYNFNQIDNHGNLI